MLFTKDQEVSLCTWQSVMTIWRTENKWNNYRLLYQLRPGLFSTATLYNGYTDTMEKMLERLRMDLEYLNNRSLWTDIKIIFQTVWAIASGKKF